MKIQMFLINLYDFKLKREVAQIIAKLAPFLDETDRVDFVLTRLIDLAHDETNS